MEPTIENLNPLIKKEINQGANYVVHFQADNQLKPIQGVAQIEVDQSQIMKNVTKQAVKSSVKVSIISMLSRFLGGLIGGRIGNEVGYAASSVATTAVGNQSMSAQSLIKSDVSSKQRDELILNAFESAKSYFDWNENEQKWEGKANLE